jgi:DNA polymerase-3 subunit delta'
MTWQNIRGHDRVVEKFRRALARGRLASTFLFVGPSGIGKRSFALALAKGLLCERVPEQRLEPCGECPSCLQVASLNHPDVEWIGKPADKAFIPLEQLIGDAEHRMRAGLCYSIALKPYSGRRKIAILDDADYLNKEGANCLLKTLEEPPAQALLILIGTSEQRQLPTIRSRCQIVRFNALTESDVRDLLLEKGLCDDRQKAVLAANHSYGSIERAALWCDAELLEFRRELLHNLSQASFDGTAEAKRIGQFVDSAGKEAAAKRNRLRLVVSLAEELYRAILLEQTTGKSSTDTELSETVSAAARGLEAAGASECMERCLEAYAHIDANVNQATLIDWWLNELAQALRTTVAAR